LLGAGTANPARHQTAAGNEVDLRQLLGHPQRMLDHRQRVTHQDDLGLAGGARQHRGFGIDHVAHAVGIAMVLVQRESVEADLLGKAVFVDELVVIVRRLLAIEVAVGNAEKCLVRQHNVFVDVAIGPLGEIAEFHGGKSPPDNGYKTRSRATSLPASRTDAGRSLSAAHLSDGPAPGSAD